MMSKFKVLLILIFIFYMFNPVAFAADVRFEATVERSMVSLGESIQLSLSFYGTQNVSAPDIGEIKGFKVRYIGPSTRMSIVNGRVSTSITHIYSLIPTKTGTFKIGPFSVRLQGKTLTSQPIVVKVVSAAPSPIQKHRPAQAPREEELRDRIFLTIEAGKSSVYLNEIVPLTIKLYVAGLAVRDIQYPEFKHDGFSVGKFAQPRQYRQNIGGITYDVIEFNTDMFAVRPGEFSLGPGRLNCSLIVRRPQQRSSRFDDLFSGFFDEDMFDDFFGRYQIYPFSVSSPQISITVLPLPEEGKPVDFKAAVGNFDFEAEVSPKEIKVGDPITVTMTITGKGNFDSVSCPILKSQEGFKVYEPEVTQRDNVKVFKQVLIPNSQAITSIPEFTFSFFDPRVARYRSLTQGPFPITVKKPSGAELKVVEGAAPAVVKTPPRERLGRDIVYIKESAGRFTKKGHYLYRDPGYWFLQLLIFIIFIAGISFSRHIQRLKTDGRYARRLAASGKAKKGIQRAQQLLAQANTKEFFEVLFKTVREYLADRLYLSAGRVTAEAIEQILKSHGASEDILKKLRKIFEVCDLARYAPSAFDEARMREILQDTRRIIDYLKRQKV
jgi:hypothetical protein